MSEKNGWESKERKTIGMASRGEGIKCSGGVKRTKHNALRRFGHLEKVRENVVTKRVYKCGDWSR